MEPIQLTTRVQPNGMIQIPTLVAGEEVDVIVLRKGNIRNPRKGGWAKDLIEIKSDFDDPIPGLEDYQ